MRLLLRDFFVEPGNIFRQILQFVLHCFEPPFSCNKEGLELPILEYTMDKGRSITGGYVYRGEKIPELFGYYIYGDLVSGRIWALLYDGKKVKVNKEILHDQNLSPLSLGIDSKGELYVCSPDGNIYQLGKI